MSPEYAKMSPESDTSGLNFNETELTLGLPGESRLPKSGNKRGYAETVGTNTAVDSGSNKKAKGLETPEPKVQVVVGWPPVRGCRKKIMKSWKYVKVGVDGAPFLRKIDLEKYNTYHHLLIALQTMFSFFTATTTTTTSNEMNIETKLVDPANGVEYVPTYEDKDGDWMLVGDVPWKMFVESCKRLRVMKSSEAIGLAPRTPEKCSSSS